MSDYSSSFLDIILILICSIMIINNGVIVLLFIIEKNMGFM